MTDRPDFTSYHKSITDELYSIKNRIRDLVKHWPTDGEAKEVALRSLLRKLLPESVIVGRGFVVAADRSSSQIDVLIADGRKPTLFKDGDLIIVTPDSVLGVIEVKTRLRSAAQFSEVLAKLSQVEELCRDVTREDRVWSGLFVFEGHSDEQRLHQHVLSGLGNAYQQTRLPVRCVSCGRDTFARYWNRGADVNSDERGPVWHSYDLPGIAPSYFVGNLVDWVSSIDDKSASFAWFPALGGK